MEAAQDRPPYVTFETVAVEDRAATIENGHYTAKDVVYAYVTPQGSKDRIPRVAEEWLENMDLQVREGRLPVAWMEHFRSLYNAFKKGEELPVAGTAIANWPAASPAQVQMLKAANLLTVEDLANANEEALGRLGMGGRALKSRAQEWLASATNSGKLAEQLAALKEKNEQLEATNKELFAQLKELSAKFDALTPAAKKL